MIRASTALGAALMLLTTTGCPGSGPGPIGSQNDSGGPFADAGGWQIDFGNSGASSDSGGSPGKAGADSGSSSADAGTSKPTSSTPKCASGWRRRNNSCYYVDYGSKRTYSEAKGACTARKARVVVIETASEDAFVYGLMPSSSSAAWIALRRVGSTSRFAWEGSTATYRNWDSGEPNDEKGIEDCAVIWGPALTYPTRRAHWNDVPCNTVPRSVVICERATSVK